MNIVLAAASLVLMSIWQGPAAAEVPLSGIFVAREACPALQSIRGERNPGAVRTEPNGSYPIVAKNRPEASHYLIEVVGAEPPRRWVAVTCGEYVSHAGGAVPSRGSGKGTASPSFVLAVSWQAAFCETRTGRGKPECAIRSRRQFDASNFSLHGLWPQPGTNIFCDVSPDHVAADTAGAWERLPAPNLTPETRRELDRMMPGAMSNLDRHEWIKHGTCFQGESAEGYFARAIALVKQLNASQVRALFASKVGSEVTTAAIRAAFDSAFGDGAGQRVRVACKRDGARDLIVELTIGLVGPIDDDPELAPLIAASEPTDPGCPRGLVDPIGLQ